MCVELLNPAMVREGNGGVVGGSITKEVDFYLPPYLKELVEEEVEGMNIRGGKREREKKKSCSRGKQ